MAYPLTQTLIDDFNRANGAIGSAYTSLSGGFNVSSNQIVGTGASNFVYRNDVTPAADCETRLAVVTLPGSGQAVRLLLRLNTTTVSGYLLVLYNAGASFTWYLYRLTNGVTLDLLGSAVTGQTFAAGDQIALQVVGTTITAYHYTGGAWVEKLSRSDSTYTAAGRIAFGTDGTTAQLDDLYGGGATQEVIAPARGVTLGGEAPQVTGGTGAVDATVTAPAGAARAGAARPVASATPVTSVKLGVIGDSDLDEFRADDNRGGVYSAVTFSPTEMLVNVLNWNLGTWATRSEPRRTGYAQNWARSTATLGTVYSGTGSHSVTGDGQHTGLAAQVTAGDVDAVAVIVGVNDFNLWNNTFQDVYNGTVAGANLTAKINSILDNLETVLDALITAGAKRILVSNYLDPVPLAAGAGYTDPTSQARVSNAINTVNAGIDTIIAARSACQLFDRYNWEDLVFDGYTRTPGVSFVVGGETITETVGDEPHNWILASSHFGTVFNGLFANAVIRALNSGFGFSLSTMTDNQIVGVINQSTDATVTAPAGSARSGGAAPALSAGAAVAAVPGRADAGSAAASVSTGVQIDAPAGSTRAGSAGAAVSGSAAVAALPGAVRLGALAAPGQGSAVASAPAGGAVATAPGADLMAAAAVNAPAGAVTASAPGAGLSASAAIGAQPASAQTGGVGPLIETGTPANVDVPAAGALLGAIGATLRADADLGIPAGGAIAGSSAAVVSGSGSVTVAAAAGGVMAGAAGAVVSAGAQLAIAPAGSLVGTAAAAASGAAAVEAGPGSMVASAPGVEMSADVLLAALVAVAIAGAAGATVGVQEEMVVPPSRVHISPAGNRVHVVPALERIHISED